MAQIPVEILTAIIGLVAAVLGYSFREFRNRISPFFSIVTIDGGVKRTYDRVSVDEDHVDELEGAFYVDNLRAETELGVVNQAWERCEEIKKAYPDIKHRVESVLASEDEVTLVGSLEELFRAEAFEKWMTVLLVNNRVDFKTDSSLVAEEEKIHVWIESKDEEVAWFDFPRTARSFGRNLGHPAIHAKFLPFILAVSRLHQPGIKNGLRQFVEIVSDEHKKALSTVHELKGLVDANSRWAFHCFMANNSQSPILIETTGDATIADPKTGTKYKRECYLAKADDDFELSDTKVPLVVKQGESMRFAMLTKEKQLEMQLGNSMREAFERRDAECRISVLVRRIGLLKKQSCMSPASQFVQYGENEEDVS